MEELILSHNEKGTITLVRDGEAVGEICVDWGESLALEVRRYDEAQTGPVEVKVP